MRFRLQPLPAFTLKPGAYFVPEHFTPAELEGTAALVQALLPGEHSIRRFDAAEELDAAVGNDPAAAGRTIAVVDGTGVNARADAATRERWEQIGFEYVIARVAGNHSPAFAWLEQRLKPAVVTALRRAMNEQAKAPAQLVRDAAALTSSPLEVVALVEQAFDDTPSEAQEATHSAEDYRRSVERVAGARVAERLARLADDGELQAAWSVLLSGGSGDKYDERFRRGAAALERVGLGSYVHGDLALGPLARAAAKPGPIQEALVASLPERAWSSQALERLDLVRPQAPKGLKHLPKVSALLFTVLAQEFEAAIGAVGEVTRHEPGFAVAELPRADPDNKPLRVGIALLETLNGAISLPRARSLTAATVPELVARCGICAGIPGRVQIGDVVVATRLVRPAARTGRFFRLDPELEERVLSFSDAHPELRPARLGEVMTTDVLLRGPLERLLARETPVLAIEAELDALRLFSEVNGIVVLGVADLIGSHKSDSNQQLAARAAAEWLIAFLRSTF